jgi:predicted transcriptional regulator
MDIEEREYIGPSRSGLLFSQQGLEELRELLQNLKEMEKASKERTRVDTQCV